MAKVPKATSPKGSDKPMRQHYRLATTGNIKGGKPSAPVLGGKKGK